MRAAAEHPLHGEPRWAAALSRLEPLVAAAEAHAKAFRGTPREYRDARDNLSDVALALFVEADRD
jgi:hypothetical protein